MQRMTPWLSDLEIADLCAGLKQPAAQRRYLKSLGLVVKSKPNGQPIVFRSDIEAIHAASAGSRRKAAQPKESQPDEAALLALIASKKGGCRRAKADLAA